MLFNSLSPWNWSSTANVWIDGIQVCFQPVIALERKIIKGGFLRQVRRVTPLAANLVALFFTVHCTKPQCREIQPRPLEYRAAIAPCIPVKETPAPQRPPQPHYHVESGKASWYGDEDKDFLEGCQTANGEVLDPEELTCAHRTLPFACLVEVTNLANQKSAILRVNDRGPYADGRVLDVSKRAADVLGFLGKGIAHIRLRAVHANGTPRALPTPSSPAPSLAPQREKISVPVIKGAGIEPLVYCGSNTPILHTLRPKEEGIPTAHLYVNPCARMEDAQNAARDRLHHTAFRGVELFVARRR